MSEFTENTQKTVLRNILESAIRIEAYTNGGELADVGKAHIEAQDIANNVSHLLGVDPAFTDRKSVMDDSF